MRLLLIQDINNLNCLTISLKVDLLRRNCTGLCRDLVAFKEEEHWYDWEARPYEMCVRNDRFIYQRGRRDSQRANWVPSTPVKSLGLRLALIDLSFHVRSEI